MMTELTGMLDNYIICGANRNDPEDLRGLAEMLNGMADELDPLEVNTDPIPETILEEVECWLGEAYDSMDNITYGQAKEMFEYILDSLYN